MPTRQARSEVELNKMIRRAMEQPGVAEALEMYEIYKEAVAPLRELYRIPQPTSVVSDSSS